MPRRRKQNDKAILALVAMFAVYSLIASIPIWVWLILAAVAIFGVAVYFSINHGPSDKKSSSKMNPTPAKKTRSLVEQAVEMLETSQPVPVENGSETGYAFDFFEGQDKFYSQPKEPPRWVPPGEPYEVRGLTIPWGMIYVGKVVAPPSLDFEPSQIDPEWAFSQRASVVAPLAGRLDYASLGSRGRRAYLEWLVGGREDKNVNQDYVILYLYGIERRVFVDAKKNPEAKKDFPAIGRELNRLLSIYGHTYLRVRRLAEGLLNWVELDGLDPKFYLKPVPKFEHRHEFPAYIQLAVGRCALDAKPIPPGLAYAWAKHDEMIGFKILERSCPVEFEQLFLHNYIERFGEGMLVEPCRRLFKVMYTPQSPAFEVKRERVLDLGRTPHVTSMQEPRQQLQALADKTNADLQPFYHHLRKSGEASRTELSLMLPWVIWPEHLKVELSKLSSDLVGGSITCTAGQLLQRMKCPSQVTKGILSSLATKGILSSLANALHSSGIGIEPDFTNSKRVPKPEDSIVLFRLTQQPISSAHSDQSQNATHATEITLLQIAVLVALADGPMNLQEIQFIKGLIDRWTHLSGDSLARLHARFRALREAPPAFAAVKKELVQLEPTAQKSIAAAMVDLAQCDGMPGPQEIKYLEKIYKAVNLETNQLFSDVHSGPERQSSSETAQFKLDPSRIAQLQEDTVKVSKLLSGIFTEEDFSVGGGPGAQSVIAADQPASEESRPPQPVQPVSSAPQDDATDSLFGLDPTHNALAKMMLTQDQWDFGVLTIRAAAMGLMLSGALEVINDACFDAYDLPFTEGEDPITVNPEILEKVRP